MENNKTENKEIGNKPLIILHKNTLGLTHSQSIKELEKLMNYWNTLEASKYYHLFTVPTQGENKVDIVNPIF